MSANEILKLRQRLETLAKERENLSKLLRNYPYAQPDYDANQRRGVEKARAENKVYNAPIESKIYDIDQETGEIIRQLCSIFSFQKKSTQTD